MVYLDRDSLALKMNSLQRWLDSAEGALTEVVRYVDHAFASVSVDPTSTARAASFNRNRIRLCGGRGLSKIELNEIAQMFDAQGVERFFVWLSPGPGIETVREWLIGQGAVKVPWTDYLTMVHMGKVMPASASAVEVRKITREDIEAGVLGPAADALMDGYMHSVGRSGYRHFAAFEGGQPIGGAVLIQFEEIGYLTYASTAEAFRRRGSHTALIAARIEEARRLGCTLILAETLTMLRDSYANLTRAGFQVAYEKEVYECVRSSAPHRSSDHEAPKLSVSNGGGSATDAAMIEVMLLNDDHTPMEFVVEVLERIFDRDRESATRIMLWIHHHGVAVCGTYPADIAAAKSAQVIEAADAHQHPLRCVVAPARR